MIYLLALVDEIVYTMTALFLQKIVKEKCQSNITIFFYNFVWVIKN